MRDRASRRQFLRATLPALAVGVAGCGQSSDSETETTASSPPGSSTTTASTGGPSDLPTLGLETLTTDVGTPLALAFPPELDWRYVADRQGAIYVHEDGALRDEPLLDLRDEVVLGGERGLLGIALHPEFDRNRRLFVRYSTAPRPGTPDDYSHTFVVAEFRASADGRSARRDSERTILEIPQPQSNHNAGDLAFGPDGYLYVPVGDGGGGGDRGAGHAADWYDANSGGNGQDVTENLLGSILRLDVDDREDDRPYAIPDDNPLVGEAGMDEQYAWGFRNPWRLSFDGADCYVGDVGQNDWEEVDLVRRGGNYGWNVREGTHCYRATECPDQTPETVRGGEPLVDPIVEYPHSGAGVSGISVIGGAVYRGSQISAFEGDYVFGDLLANGRLFVARPADEGLWPTSVVEIGESDSSTLQQLLSIERGPDGELYVLGSGEDGSGVHRVVEAPE